MDTSAAFAMGQANRDKQLMVFDWDLAAKLIGERKPDVVSAGLSGDWEWTGGTIYRSGRPLTRDETYTYLASTWATPQIDLDGELKPCFRMQSETPDWNSETFWPESSVAILEAAGA